MSVYNPGSRFSPKTQHRICPSIISFNLMSTPNRVNSRRSLTLLQLLSLVGISAVLCSALLRHFY
ncbi:conserved hypothetical protein [Paraburkholderia piptadeniae]|uniref:Uncharacterized protein n=1 Tax=Paraburkholderia piptadeniae TaxID=1701573 RepID=A0A1N7RQD8_9BURK|nr:conserved hypothetical protein [Paraburkholderia piptadeniae]